MHLLTTRTTNSSTTSFAKANLSTTLNTNAFWLDPLATFLCRTIHTILRRILLILPVPLLLKLLIEEFLHMTQRYVPRLATTRRHMCRIRKRQRKYTPQTVVTHPVSTCKFCRT